MMKNAKVHAGAIGGIMGICTRYVNALKSFGVLFGPSKEKSIARKNVFTYTVKREDGTEVSKALTFPQRLSLRRESPHGIKEKMVCKLPGIRGETAPILVQGQSSNQKRSWGIRMLNGKAMESDTLLLMRGFKETLVKHRNAKMNAESLDLNARRNLRITTGPLSKRRDIQGTEISIWNSVTLAI